MKLEQAPDDIANGYFHVLQSQTGIVRMAIYPVIYGYRVRGWFSNDMGCTIDWCGGDDQKTVEYLYSILKNILESREEGKEAFKKLPGASRIKPFVKDQEFTAEILSQVVENLELVTLPDLRECKLKLFHQCFTP